MSKLTHRLAAAFVSAAVLMTIGSARAVQYAVSEEAGGLAIAISDLPESDVVTLVAGFGDKNYGENLTDWPQRVVIGAAVNGATLMMAYPEGWGSSVKELAIFTLMGEDAALPDVNAYVRDGLEAHWDALTGVVLGETAADNLWVDRIHGYAFSLSGCTIKDNGVINLPAGADKALLGDDAAAVSASLLNSGVHTMEWTLKVNSGNYAFYGTAASHIIFCAYGNSFILSPDRDLGLYINNAANSTYSVTYDHSETAAAKFIIDRYRDGVVTGGLSSYWNAGGDKMRIGGDANVDCCSLRIYNRRLTPTEFAINAKIDGRRYRGEAFDPTVLERGTCIAKMSSTEGLAYRVTAETVRCTVTGEGWYKYGEQVTLTATPPENTNFLRWELGVPAECSAGDATIEFELHGAMVLRAHAAQSLTLDAINRDGDGNPVSAVLSFATPDATNTLFMAYGETDAGASLDGWGHVEAVGVVSPEITSRTVPFPEGWGDDDGPKKLRYFLLAGVGTESIIKKNLLAHWDAIDNQATGTHDETATGTWVDLVADREVVLTNASVGDDVIDLTATGSYGFLGDEDTQATFAHGTVRTVEFRARVPSNSGSSALLAAPSASGVGVCLWGGGFAWPYTSYDVSGKTGAPLVRALQNMKTIALGYSGNSCNALYLDGAEPVDFKNDSYSFITKPTAGTYFGSGAAGDQKMSCKFQVVRVYDGAPDAGTVLNNHLADHARFVDGLVLGGVESYSDALDPHSDIHGTFKIVASVPHGTVLGIGEYEAGSEVTLSVQMKEGYSFVCWLGDLPEGCDAHSPTLTFTAAAHVNLTGFIQMPWEVITDASGNVTKVTNSVWTIAASATGKEMKLLAPTAVSELGQREELDKALDFTTFEAMTGYRITEIGDNAFAGKRRLATVRFVGEDLVRIGDVAFYESNTSSFSPEYLPNLEYLGGNANLNVRSFVAPKLKYFASGSVSATVTNFEPRVINWNISSCGYMLSGYKSLRGGFEINVPAPCAIPNSFMWSTAFDYVIVNSPITSIGSWAFYECSRSLKIYWNVPAPKSVSVQQPMGTRDPDDAAAGGLGLTKPTPQLIVSKLKTIEGFKQVTGLTFTPREELDSKYLTKAYGCNARCVGILTNANDEHIWLVRPGVGTIISIQ